MLFLLCAEAYPEGSEQRDQAVTLMAEASELLRDSEKKKKVDLLGADQLDEELGLSKPKGG
jgi:DnaJ-class molecular chaperone